MGDIMMLVWGLVAGGIAFFAGFLVRISVYKKQKKNIVKLKKGITKDNERIVLLMSKAAHADA